MGPVADGHFLPGIKFVKLTFKKNDKYKQTQGYNLAPK